MRRRSYEDDADVARLQRFNAESIAATDGCGYLHPGDIAHHLFYGNRDFDPADLTTIWEDESGMAGWVLAHPRFRAYDIQVRPDLRGGAFEREVLEHADARIVEVMQANGVESDVINGQCGGTPTVTRRNPRQCEGFLLVAPTRFELALPP